MYCGAAWRVTDMACTQMTGGGASVVLGPSDPDTWHPDLDWLAAELQGPRPPKLVYVVSPGNPTGTPLPIKN